MLDLARRRVEAGLVAFETRDDMKVEMEKMLVAGGIVVLPKSNAVGRESFLCCSSYPGGGGKDRTGEMVR